MTKKSGRSAENDPGLSALLIVKPQLFVLLENLGIFMLM